MKNIGITFTTSLLSAILAVFIYRYFEEPKIIIREVPQAKYTKFDEHGDPFSGTSQRKYISSSPTDFTTAAHAVTPAVVNIKSLTKDSDFWTWNASFGASSGSGVIISSDGLILTNNHVIEDGEKIEVTLNDKREFKARVIGIDTSTDLALIKVEDEKARNLPHLTFGNSDSLAVGEWVLAVGNPFELESTVTAGIVSAKGRNIDILDDAYSIESFIQTDAAVNPGNSGGALVNTNGELIGINTAIITRSGRYEGYSFAIPANLARKVVRDLKDFGEVQRGILGVGIEQVDSQLAEELGLKSIAGIHINRITPESGADDAGLSRGDVIVAINGIKTNTMPELQEQVGRYRPGNTISLEYIRAGKKKRTKVTLKNKSNGVELTNKTDGDDVLKNLGFDVRNLTTSEERRLRISGVKVVSIHRDSKIERTNMDPGFIITKMDNTTINNIEDLLEILKIASGKVMLEGVYENYPGEYYYAFPVD